MGKVLYNIAILLLCVPLLHVGAQNSFEEFRRQKNAEFSSFRRKANEDFEAFRKKINDEYAAMVEKSWKELGGKGKRPVPEDKVKPVPPVVYPKDENKKPQPKPKPLPFDDVVTPPKPQPQPEPIVPIEEKVMPSIPEVSFTFFGTRGSVHFNMSDMVKLNNVDERSVANAWRAMSTESYSALVSECLSIRKERNLCDWAYLVMLNNLADKICGKGTNSSTLLMAYLYCQSGYKMRLARDTNNVLYMMYASDYLIFGKEIYVIEGVTYYPYGGSPKSVYFCNVSYPQERQMSLSIRSEQQLSNMWSESVTRSSVRYPEVSTTIRSNKNLMAFYETYPTSMVGENSVSRWAMYANTPMSGYVKEQMYPSLRSTLKGCDQLTAVNKLLNYVQTGFVYEYDDKVWGHDRAFFAEESLFYPYCDCEDRSILFTRLVRDLLGLDCILIYYPGHLASAVHFTEREVNGDYIILNNIKYIVSDATYIGAPVGRTMPGMNNEKAKVILLERN